MWKIFYFVTKPSNLIDLSSILPTYIALAAISPYDVTFFRAIRAMRILRVLRLVNIFNRMKSVNVAIDLISVTLQQAFFMLSIFSFFGLVSVVIFGSIIYICERGDFTVTAEYPNGAFLRGKNHYDNQLDESPFDSIATGIYWAISTITGSGT